jgi:hypothetical protein
MITKDDVFDLSAYQNAHYTATHWLWETPGSGPQAGFPWARWVGDETKMPAGPELAHLSDLVALQLGDEWHLDDVATRDRAVNWFNAIRNQWPDTILYMNNWGGQVNDAALGDFITRAKPDMLAFDTYPFTSSYPSGGAPYGPSHGSPTNWYSEMRKYRVHAQNASYEPGHAGGVPWGIYRQTFHAVQDYNQTIYRDPSPSEMNLNTYGALAFGATTFIDFTYNTGASSVAPSGTLQPGYALQAEINRRARNLGKALVHLTGKDSPSSGANPTLDIMFRRGKTGLGTTDVTPLPIGFNPDDGLPNTISEWIPDRNDPYMRGWTVTNLGAKNGGLSGDVIISWFKPLDATKDDPNDVDDQLYFMVVNGLTGPDGTAADYRQRVKINFLSAVGPTLQRLNDDTGAVEFVNLELTNGRRFLDITLDGGAGQLFKFNTGHAFLGTSQSLSGDYNGDGLVDAADYVVWRKGSGTLYNSIPYGTWNREFGTSSNGAGSSSDSQAAVPEPASLVVFASVAALSMAGCNFQRTFSRKTATNRE